jgi:hypothetical protein
VDKVDEAIFRHIDDVQLLWEKPTPPEPYTERRTRRMIDKLKHLYARLPVVRELQAVQDSLRHAKAWQRKLRLLETTTLIQAIQAIKASDPRYQDPRRLLASGAQYWSQNYEDGMIAEVFLRVPPATKTFLEIGVGDGSENNTTALLAQGWRGWWIEGEGPNCASIRERMKDMPSIASRLTLREAFVSPVTIRELLRQLQVPTEVDLFSLDIDLDTYHIWAALEDFRPRVIVVEYNSALPPGAVWIHPYRPGRMWDGTQAFGASLKAYEMLGRRYGYSLVGCDLTGINAFFVRDDLIGNHFAAPFTAENHYEPPRYGMSCRWAHPSAFYGENHGQ